MEINVDMAEEQLQLCEQITETEGTCYPDDTYEDGIKAALLWALGLGPAPSMPRSMKGRSHCSSSNGPMRNGAALPPCLPDVVIGY